MNTNYSKIDQEYKELTEYVNNIYYPDGEGSIQEHLFQLGLDFCIDRPKFYSDCESFWNYYVREFYDRMSYILFGTMRGTCDKADNLFKNYNKILELPDSIREDIFIEYQTKIDQRLKPKSKTIQVGAKNKKVPLKEI